MGGGERRETEVGFEATCEFPGGLPAEGPEAVVVLGLELSRETSVGSGL